jgi:hypothetical protein
MMNWEGEIENEALERVGGCLLLTDGMLFYYERPQNALPFLSPSWSPVAKRSNARGRRTNSKLKGLS